MRLNRFLKTMGPLAALVAMGALAGCDKVHFNVGEEGVPLAELDLGGTPPDSVALLGPDTVIVSEGADFTITVDGEGPVAERMRFKLDGGTLGILREGDNWSEEGGIATVRVTMPPPNSLSLAGSGDVRIDRVEGEEFAGSIAGPGELSIGALDVDEADFRIGGSGNVVVAGAARETGISIGGSGEVHASGLRSETALVSIDGSGDVALNVEDRADVSIRGSGDVAISGPARCSVTQMGSGDVRCEGGGGTD